MRRAGFRGGANPEFISGVAAEVGGAPETYPLVQRIAQNTGRDIRSLIGDSGFLKRLDPKQFTDETFGLPTVTDIPANL